MIKPVRVLNLTENASMGGINTFSIVTASEFAKVPDIEIVYAALSDQPSGWFFDRMQQLGFNVNWIPCFQPPDLGVLLRLREFVRRNEVDVVQTNGFRGNFYVRAMIDLGLANLPTVVVKHGLPPANPFRNRVYYWADQRPTRRASMVIAVDGYTFEFLKKKWKVSINRLKLVRNPAPWFHHPPQRQVDRLVSELDLDKGIPVILFLGRLEREKGIYELLQAHKKMCERNEIFYLLIVGEGAAQTDIVSCSQEQPAGKYIRWVGTQMDVNPYLALCNLFVLPSYSEGLPFSLLEAMSAGKPVIATSVGGIPDAIKDLSNGFLIQPQKVDSLIDKISFVLSQPDLGRSIGLIARQTATTNFSINTAVEQISAVYRLACIQSSTRAF